jgi:hypothetical protein
MKRFSQSQEKIGLRHSRQGMDVPSKASSIIEFACNLKRDKLLHGRRPEGSDGAAKFFKQ